MMENLKNSFENAENIGFVLMGLEKVREEAGNMMGGGREGEKKADGGRPRVFLPHLLPL